MVTTMEMEILLAARFNPRVNTIVPNISWGMFIHECDLLIVRQSGYAVEVEIKISKADLIKDTLKRHGHYSDKINYLYFAIPDYLQDYIAHIPERAGIIVVETQYTHLRTKEIRKPTKTGSYKFTDKERLKVARLGCMRIWGLKQKINDKNKAQEKKV